MKSLVNNDMSVKCVNVGPTGHSVLSPSGAERWLHCAASARLERDLAEAGGMSDGGAAAAEGTLAHECAAEAVLSALGEDDLERSAALTTAYASGDVSGDMEECAETYRDYVMGLYRSLLAVDGGTRIYVERGVSLDVWMPGCGGTADCLICGNGVLHVVDYKFGAGVSVSAVENAQLKLYALGALGALGDAGVRVVWLHIVQPRCGGLSVWKTCPDDLYRFGGEVQAAARAALCDGGEAVPGLWCRFCRARGCCRALTDVSLRTATGLPDVRLISDRDLGERVLPMVGQLRAWLSSVEDYALERVRGGAVVPGWKVGAGRSMRYITDVAEAHRRLNAAGYDDADIVKPEELVGLTEMEKIVGRKRFAELVGDLIEKRAGREKLVRDGVAEDFK